MSDYTLEKVVRFKIEESRFLELLNVEDIWDLETHAYFGNGVVDKFQIAPTEDFFVDFVNIEHSNTITSNFVDIFSHLFGYLFTT